MPKPNIVLCFDGTSNQFGPNNTNVIRLVHVADQRKQKLYYDAGIGTLPDPRLFTRVAQRISEYVDLAFGVGLPAKVEAAYRFLMEHWRPGCKVFIFGFSRGAYTARVLAGMLHSLGLLSPGNQSLVTYAFRLFQSSRGGADTPRENNYWRLSNGFRNTFARETGDHAKRFPIHFLGIWDTVSSIGWVWEPKSYPYASSLPNVEIARHAVAMDERRAFYRKNGLKREELESGRNWQELWFPGVHADVGGGYPEADGNLWLVALRWIVEEAANNGLLLDCRRWLELQSRFGSGPRPVWTERAHDSLTSAWKIAEYFPKRRWERQRGYHYRANLFRPRTIQPGEMIHESVIRRVQDLAYRPRQFSDSFIKKLQNLNPVPPAFPFET